MIIWIVIINAMLMRILLKKVIVSNKMGTYSGNFLILNVDKIKNKIKNILKRIIVIEKNVLFKK